MHLHLNDLNIFSMFKTFFNAILISIMVFVNCDNPILIRNDRVYRYVGNTFDESVLPNETNEANETAEDNLKDMYKTNADSTSQTLINNENKSKEIPESLLIELKDIKDASEFIANFLTPSANKVTNANRKDIFLEYLQRETSENPSTDQITLTEDRKKLNKLPKISKPAGCEPEMKIIELQPSNVRNEIYFPSCVRLPRCSGCCPSQRLQCVPISKSFEDITVMRVKYSTTENRLKFEGFKVFRIEKHDNCSCDCIQKASDCSLGQFYLKSQCRCVCPNLIEANECQMNPNKYWDYNDCNCKCKSVPLCSTGLFYNNQTCRCETEQSIISTSNVANVRNSSILSTYNYFFGESENSEVKIQRTKGLDIFNSRGINPELDEDYHKLT